VNALQPYAAFARAIEAGSFSAVARDLGTSQSSVSKQIAALEASLGVQLFARTTRRLQPTAEAMELYEHVRQLLDAVESLKTVSGHEAVAAGTLRVTAPSSYGRRRICPLLPKFLELHPQVRVELVLTDQVADLVEDGFELGIRMGPLPSTTLRARPLGIVEMLLVATPEYLAKHGTPETPGDLAEHPCIVYSAGARWTRWEFESETGRHAAQVTGPIRVNDHEAMHMMICAHQGIGLIPDWVVGDDLSSGRLRWLMQDFYPIPQPVNIVYPQTRFLSRRARSFIDFMVTELRERR
jgi:DNA-binding transcriptional LysR family regulator